MLDRSQGLWLRRALPRLTPLSRPKRNTPIRAIKEATRQLGSEVSHPATPVATIVSEQHGSAMHLRSFLFQIQFTPLLAFLGHTFANPDGWLFRASVKGILL